MRQNIAAAAPIAWTIAARTMAGWVTAMTWPPTGASPSSHLPTLFRPMVRQESGIALRPVPVISVALPARPEISGSAACLQRPKRDDIAGRIAFELREICIMRGPAAPGIREYQGAFDRLAAGNELLQNPSRPLIAAV